MDFKNKPVEQAYIAFQNHIEDLIIEFFNSHINQQSALVKSYRLLYKKLPETNSRLENLMHHVNTQQSFRKKIFTLLEKHQKAFSDAAYGDLIFHIKASFNTWLQDLPETIEIKEASENYIFRAIKNPFIFPKAAFLNAYNKAIVIILKFRNVIRKMTKRKALDLVVYRYRKVPFHSLLTEYFHNKYLLKSGLIWTALLEQSSSLLIQLWEADEKLDAYNHAVLVDEQYLNFDFKEISELLDNIVEQQKQAFEIFQQQIFNLGSSVFNNMDDEFSIVDTLYVPFSRYKKNRVDKNAQKLNASTANLLDGWSRSYIALLDDWTLDVEITLLYFSVFDLFNDLQLKIDSFIDTDLSESFKVIEQYLADSRQRIELSQGTKKGLKQILSKERCESGQKLIDKSITSLIEKLTICFTTDFDKFVEKTKALVNKVSETRVYIKARKYNSYVLESEIERISPSELLYFEALPRFEAVAEKIKQFTDLELENARAKLVGVSTVWDFSLESAIFMLDEAKGRPKNAVQGVVEGADRAVAHLKEAETALVNIRQTIDSDFRQGIIHFNEDIQKLKNTDNIFELNLRIARIKAYDKSRQLRQKAIEMIKNLLPVIIHLGKTLYFKFLRKFKAVKVKIGFVENKKYVTFELSEFINETQEALKKLPFVYQRLFELSPTDESRFFVNREKELGYLKQAFVDWQKDRFITVALIGDKGSGITSLLNYFLANNNLSLKTDRATLSEKLNTHQKYLKFFSELFEQKSFDNNQAIIDYLNNSGQSRIVIIENLHHFYLKEVNGFDNLQRLFELMSNTLKKVFWVGAITKNVWNYLDKTIFISNYFTNEVLLSALAPEALEEIITRRNKISGFRLNFIPEAELLENKSFMQLSEEEKQEFLRKNLFKKLSRLSYGNISLAQLYWLRLTREVKENTIDIGYFKEIDFSFIKDLSAQELFVMQTIVLHDGLVLSDFSRVMDMTEADSKNILVPMLEKGLLIKPREKYNINPIIFNPVVNYLQSRNYIG